MLSMPKVPVCRAHVGHVPRDPSIPGGFIHTPGLLDQGCQNLRGWASMFHTGIASGESANFILF